MNLAPTQFSTGLKIASIRIVPRGFLSDISSSITLQGTSITAPSRTWRYSFSLFIQVFHLKKLNLVYLIVDMTISQV